MTDGFVVEIKKSARVRNAAVEGLYERDGPRITYGSEEAAREAVAALASRGDGPVRLQAVAPQDGAAVDGYLVGASRHRIEIPDTPPEDGWSFGVDASQYGALGEALLTAGDGAARPLRTFVRYDHDLPPETPLTVAVDADPTPVTVPGTDGRWEPDCVIEASVGHRLITSYACEVKTGAGRLERRQAPVIEAAARDRPVLVVFVDVTGLPEQYEVRFEKIDNRGPGAHQEQLTFDDLA